jgi:hypothetical protein
MTGIEIRISIENYNSLTIRTKDNISNEPQFSISFQFVTHIFIFNYKKRKKIH